ncbi:MAG: WbqC family protein [Deltaproteobacteria bacterium]|uniref:WbqC family protein n=1 Tax=Candidatus Zymogenus saltonus TaxID=2844893 RepID=A0A9D8KFW1_9DELT|nr:WbqC family protein [Candidatus Zymogenus saltonus]
MIVAIHQPQYLPWLGYFDKIDRADAFVFLDTVQFKKNEFQNRNRIKGTGGAQWLTVPVFQRHGQRISEVAINNTDKWQKKHVMAVLSCYGKAPFFGEYFGAFEELLSRPWEGLSSLNMETVRLIASILKIETEFYTASELGDFPEERDGRLVQIVKELGADTYLAGAGGREYMDTDIYADSGIEVVFQDFKHPAYPQLFGEFVPYLSVVDLIFNAGKSSLDYIRGNT